MEAEKIQVPNNKSEVQKYLQGDPVIWLVTVLLALLSIPLVYSSTGSLAFVQRDGDTEYYLVKHIMLIILALGAAWVCHKIDYIYYSRISRLAMIISVPLLLMALMFGSTLNSASRWLTIPLTGFTFQPSDLAKLALVTNLASMLAKRQQNIQVDQDALVQLVAWSGVICCLIGLSDISSAALLFMTCLTLMFIGRVTIKHLGLMLAVGAMAGFIAYQFGQRGETADSRIEQYVSSDKVSYQMLQSYIALSSGGMTGIGMGQSIAKNTLPHSYSDFIYAIVGEEYGFIGAVVIMCLYLILLYRGMLLVAKSDRPFGGLLAVGLSLSLTLQAMVHMGVVTGVLPTTGLTLPLLSMGGTSLLFTGVGIGIILSVSRAHGEQEGGLAAGTNFSSNGKRNVIRRDPVANKMSN